MRIRADLQYADHILLVVALRRGQRLLPPERSDGLFRAGVGDVAVYCLYSYFRSAHPQVRLAVVLQLDLDYFVDHQRHDTAEVRSHRTPCRGHRSSAPSVHTIICL